MNAAIRHTFCALALGFASIASARPSTPQHAPAPQAEARSLPSWDRLTPAQRELLLAPLRERWDANPGDRARMYDHATRWRQMTPEQRERARRGLRHWERMDPDHRREMRALFEKMRAMTPEQRNALRDRWHSMTPGQRRAWVEANPPQAAQ
jgi:hypothetical protein